LFKRWEDDIKQVPTFPIGLSIPLRKGESATFSDQINLHHERWGFFSIEAKTKRFEKKGKGGGVAISVGMLRRGSERIISV